MESSGTPVTMRRKTMKRATIAATKFSLGGKYEHPSRLAIFEWRFDIGSPIEWSIHWQLEDGGTFGGDYYNDMPIAEFLDRIKKNNQQFNEGTASHLPGIDFINTEGIDEIQIVE